MNTKKLLALVLVLALVICTLPVVFAAGGEPATPKPEDIGMNPSDVPADDEKEEPVILYGDANCDGEVTGRDATRILQYVAEWDVEIDLAAADANGDGEVTGRDATRVLQYVAEWDVILGPQ